MWNQVKFLSYLNKHEVFCFAYVSSESDEKIGSFKTFSLCAKYIICTYFPALKAFFFAMTSFLSSFWVWDNHKLYEDGKLLRNGPERRMHLPKDDFSHTTKHPQLCFSLWRIWEIFISFQHWTNYHSQLLFVIPMTFFPLINWCMFSLWGNGLGCLINFSIKIRVNYFFIEWLFV